VCVWIIHYDEIWFYALAGKMKNSPAVGHAAFPFTLRDKVTQNGLYM